MVVSGDGRESVRLRRSYQRRDAPVNETIEVEVLLEVPPVGTWARIAGLL